MKIILTKDDVMKIICRHFDIEFVETNIKKITPLGDKIYWEGNPEPKENGK